MSDGLQESPRPAPQAAAAAVTSATPTKGPNANTAAAPVVKQGISVSCRVRPLSAQEALNPKTHMGVRCLEDSIIFEAPVSKNMGGVGYSRSSTPKDRQFYLDHVFHPHTSQDEVYRTTCQHVVKALFEGINGSILAYGSTGAGKTYTMFGSGLSAGGVIYQAVQDIFDEKDRLELTEGKYVAITCTFLEVYNEEVFDLLAKKRQPLAIREDEGNQLSRGGGTVNVEALSIKGLTRAAPRDIVEFDGIIELGRRNRFTATTNANEQSSRSHAIISVEVEVRENESSSVGTIARIRLCDLAGSERAAATTNRGIRIREGGNINKSLLALGTVVQALAKRSKLPPNKASEVFVPYRGSKLTRLLRDCLGGNCYTAMLFCVTPSILGFEESINTMLFAMQAKLVQVAAKRNEFTVNVAEVARNQENIIERLRAELAVVKEELVRVYGETGRGPVDFNALMLSASGALAIEDDDANKQQNTNSNNNNQQLTSARRETSLISAISNSPLHRTDGDRDDDIVSALSSASPQRNRSASMTSTSLVTSPKVEVALVDGGSLILEGASAGGGGGACINGTVLTPRAPTPTQIPSAALLASRGRNPSLVVGGSDHHPNGSSSTNMPQRDYVCAELRQRLKLITDEKTTLHRELQANSDKQASLELQIRRERVGLCELMATMPRGEMPNPPPIRVVGQLQAISQAQSRLNDLRNAYDGLNAMADQITARVNAIGKETIRERTVNPVVELLVENASLKFALLDAEAFAAEYNSKVTQAEFKYEEANEALHRCQEVLRELLPVADARDKEKERDYDRAALLAANSATSSGGGAGVGTTASLPTQPPISLGRRCASVLALSTAPDSRTEEIMDQFRKTFTRCYNKLTSKGALLGYDGGHGEGSAFGIGGGNLIGLSDTPIKNHANNNGGPSAMRAAGSSSNVMAMMGGLGVGGGGAGGVSGSKKGSGGGGGSALSAGGLASVSTTLGGGGASGAGVGQAGGGNFSRLLSAHPQSMLSSQTMRDLRKKAGVMGLGSTLSGGGVTPSRGSAAPNAKENSLFTPTTPSTSTTSTKHADPVDESPLSASYNVEKLRNTSPYRNNVNNGGAAKESGGVGFTVSKANGRPSERIKANANVPNSPSTAGSGGKIIKPREGK